jgi:hypothetical protein
MKNYSLAPTGKQITLVENICGALGIKNFPTSSKEFTKFSFSQFIAAHLDEYHYALLEMDSWEDDEEYLYETCINDIWTEMF